MSRSAFWMSMEILQTMKIPYIFSSLLFHVSILGLKAFEPLFKKWCCSNISFCKLSLYAEMLCPRVGCCPACFGKALFCLQGISFNVSLTPRHLQPSWFSLGPLGAGWKQPSPLGHFSTEWALKMWEGCGSRKECGGFPKLAVQTVVTPPFLPLSSFYASFSRNFS